MSGASSPRLTYFPQPPPSSPWFCSSWALPVVRGCWASTCSCVASSSQVGSESRPGGWACRMGISIERAHESGLCISLGMNVSRALPCTGTCSGHAQGLAYLRPGLVRQETLLPTRFELQGSQLTERKHMLIALAFGAHGT